MFNRWALRLSSKKLPWVPEVFLALFYEDELYEDTSGENEKPRMKSLWHPGTKRSSKSVWTCI